MQKEIKKLSDDCWNVVFAFCNHSELCHISCTSKEFHLLSDRSCAWEILCRYMWSDKQNHPAERWVQLFPLSLDTNNSTKLANIIGIPTVSRDEPQEVDIDAEVEYNQELADFDINGVMLMHDAILEEIEQMQELLVVRNPQALESFAVLVGRLQSIGYNINRVRALDKLAKQRASQSAEDRATAKRTYAPLTRAMLCYRICTEKFLIRNHFDNSQDEEQKRTDSDASSQRSMRALIDTILPLFTRELKVTEFQTFMDELGLLLSWKESYRASVEDSKRRFITYEELREQGDWFILFDRTLEMCRFVEGGVRFVDARAFREACCNIGLHRERLYFRDIRQAGSVYRTADWGWEIELDNGLIVLSSFDRKSGKNAYNGRLAEGIDGRLEDVDVPVSSLLLDPLYGVYSV